MLHLLISVTHPNSERGGRSHKGLHAHHPHEIQRAPWAIPLRNPFFYRPTLDPGAGPIQYFSAQTVWKIKNA